MAFIKCSDLAVGYEGKAVAEGLNFEVNEGDYLCIVGENGAGKTTLMKTMLHLTKIISGTIEYGDGLKPYEIGYLPQQTITQQDFPASVEEIVMSGNLSKLGLRPFYNKAERAEAKKNMKRMDIYDLKNKSFRNLSGGQKQRVLLARALCASTKLIVLDEPVSGLDPKVTLDFYQLIKKLNDEGMTVIMVSHDIHEGLKDASHILHVTGKQLYFGEADKYPESDAYKLLTSIELKKGAKA
ncbi:MAG: metal ABC transporter ATP-binding protein [Lachnospiraceae bacterium]|nr:metal ABC transporter ATP-binding protein [Lachnospiraceae bacterium]